MLLNTIFGFLVPLAASYGKWSLIVVRFIQGLGEVRIMTEKYKTRISLCKNFGSLIV